MTICVNFSIYKYYINLPRTSRILNESLDLRLVMKMITKLSIYLKVGLKINFIFLRSFNDLEFLFNAWNCIFLWPPPMTWQLRKIIGNLVISFCIQCKTKNSMFWFRFEIENEIFGLVRISIDPHFFCLKIRIHLQL